MGVGFGGFNGYGLNFDRTISDTSVTTGMLRPYAPIRYLSVGVQAQRNFYKRVFLYSGLDFSFAYGKGSADTTFETGYLSGGGSLKGGGTLSGITIASATLTPYIGIKLELKHLAIGTEASLIHLNYTTQKFPNFPGNARMLNFDLGSLEQRFYVGWRF